MKKPESPPTSKRMVYTYCAPHGCGGTCSIKTYVQDERVVGFEPNEKDLFSTLCVKGWAHMQRTYHPERLKSPLKRIGGRGEGKWAPVTWDRALTEIAEKLKEIKAQYGNQAIAAWGPHVSWHGFPSPRGSIKNLLRLFGGCIDGSARGHLCGGANGSMIATEYVFGTRRVQQSMDLLQNSKLFLAMGWNFIETKKGIGWFLFDLKKKPLGQRPKFISIDPRFTRTAAKVADEWIPIKPGTDLTLFLSMIQVILREDLYDHDFVEKCTVAPFLVRDDNGFFLRESHIIEGGSSKNYVLWDGAANSLKSVPPQTDELPGVKPLHLGTFEVKGIQCRTALQALYDLCELYPPERAETITDIPAGTIRRLAREVATMKPVAMPSSSNGVQCRQWNGDYMVFGQCVLLAITGNIGIAGGGMLSFGRVQPEVPSAYLSLPKLTVPDYQTDVPYGSAAFPAQKFADAVLNPEKYWGKVKVWDKDGKTVKEVEAKPNVKALIGGGNLLVQNPDTNKTIEALKKLELFVEIDLFMTPTAEWADYVLPVSIFPFEKTAIVSNRAGGRQVAYSQGVKPLFGAKSDLEIAILLAEKLDLADKFGEGKTDEEWIGEYLRYCWEKFPVYREANITLERLKKEGLVTVAEELLPSRVPLADRKFPTPSGRIEIYSERLLKGETTFGTDGMCGIPPQNLPLPGQEDPQYHPLPVYEPPREGPEKTPELFAKYPLRLLEVHTQYTAFSQFSNVPWVLEAAPYHGRWVEIHPEDAKARGIEEGDEVIIYNDRGRIEAVARLTQTIKPGCVAKPHDMWPNQTSILTGDAAPYFTETAIYNGYLVNVRKKEWGSSSGW